MNLTTRACIAFPFGRRSEELSALRVVAELAEVDEDARLVADDLRVVPGRDRHDVAGPAFALGAVVHDHLHPPGHAVAEVGDLARVGPGDRLDVLGPPPARLEGATADHPAADVHHLSLAVALERSHLVGGVEALYLYVRHSCAPSVGSPGGAPGESRLRRAHMQGD